jgi:hypothetical protein
MSNSNAKFLTGAPMRHVAVMSATASIGLMAMFVVDFVDMIFISMLGNAAFNNLGHPHYSTWINWGRHTIGTIPFLNLGEMWFGPVGVLAGPYVGRVIFGLLGLALARRVMDQSQDTESEVQTHQAHQLRLFHLSR